jgi:hypothetical protein
MRGAVRWSLLAGTALLATQGDAHAQTSSETWRVQIKATRDSMVAVQEAHRAHDLLDGEFPVFVERTRRWHAVRVGEFQTADSARPLLARIRRVGYGDAWLAAKESARTLLVIPKTVEEVEVEAETRPDRPLATDGEFVFYEGHHDGGTCRTTWGWVWDVRHPDEPVAVDIYEADSLLATVVADRERKDLVESGKGSGAHAFRYRLPPPVGDGRPRFVQVRVAGTEVPLHRSPRWLECARADSTRRRANDRDITRKELRALPRTGAIQLDGRLDERSWDRAVFVFDFLQKGRLRGFPPRERTEVAFLYDDEALYVGARLQRRKPTEIRALVARRDDPGADERFLVSLDTYLDRQTAYTFGVTAGGVRLDFHHPRDRERDRDESFDPVWEAKTVVDSAGWTAEMRIPFSQLRFTRDAPTWGVNLRRWDPETQMNAYWVVVPLFESGWASRFGNLTGLPTIQSASRFELAPYVLGSATMLEERPDEGVPSAQTADARFGGDAKLGLGSNLTLDATVNPDFGQVEADPAEVNLSAFETFFEERRPFFSEGSHLFRGQGPRYLYSRRIGPVPQAVGLGNVVDPPDNSTILGATKLTGRLPSGLSIGGLAAVTARERARLEGTEGGPETVIVAPTTVYGIGRLQKEIGTAGSTIGLILSSVFRDLTDASALERQLSNRAFAGGGDWTLRLGEGAYEVRGNVGFSHVAGDSTAMLRLQRSSARYFQRPDAGHVEVDSSRTALAGYNAGLEVERLTGAWLWALGGTVVSPGFEINDAGILQSADAVDAYGSLQYRRTGLRGALRNYSLGVSLASGWNLDGVRQLTSPGLFASLTWKNQWDTFLQIDVDTRAQSDELTRGGPLMGTPRATNLRGGISSGSGELTRWSLNGGYYEDEFGGWRLQAHAGLSIRPSAQWGFGLYPGFYRADESRQYYGTLAGGGEATFGRRYVFAFLERSEAYAQLRVDFAPTPDLSLELYAEPFVSAGRFHDFGELPAPRSRELRFYGTDGTQVTEEADGSLTVTDGDDTFVLWNADFNVRSFRSNAVLRWEWLRGSTLYLIWQQTRWLWEDRWDPAQPGSLWSAVTDPGEHILVAKLTYWVSFD